MIKHRRSNRIGTLRAVCIWSVTALAISSVATLAIAEDQANDGRPNVLILLADDLGFGDIGCFGSEIETPSIDRIAREGLQFTHFRATPMCVTSRIALMAGMPMHRAGRHSYSHAIPLAKLMKTAGYRTMMTGKWHGGTPSPQSPELFDRAFGFLGGATDSFVGGNDWFLNDQSFNAFDDGFYSTTAFTDRSIEFMQEAVDQDQPFMMYVAFNAPHHPCQAPRETVAKYMQTYRRGYQVLRDERRQRQVQLGLVDPSWAEAPIEHEVRRWNDLTQHRQDVETQRMAAYAAAVDEVDQGIGEMLRFLQDAGIADDTLVIFMSDNGGDYNNGAIDTDELQIPWEAGANPSSSNGWASVKCSPFRYYKHSCHEGGVATPMVIRWPAGIDRPAGEKVSSPTSITDIYPTLIELAGIDYPDQFEGREKRKPTGRSLTPLFAHDGQRKNEGLFQWYAFSKSWIEDEWKVVSLYNGPWRLYDLSSDRCESYDLADEHPERLAALVDKWNQFATESDAPGANEQPQTVQHGWGWHRLGMACGPLKSVTPSCGDTIDPKDVRLEMLFDGTISLNDQSRSEIAIYDVSDESAPVWKAAGNTGQLGPDGNSVTFDVALDLQADTHYSIRWQAGWLKINGKPIGPVNDGAYWWRFRTR